MFLRAYRREDKRPLQQLFFHTVHTVNGRDHAPEQLDAWAPAEPDRERWTAIDSQFCFVVEWRKVLVGFASMSAGGRLEFLYVHQDFQGKGIGLALLRQIERLARKKGFATLCAEVNGTARSFFEKNGFVSVGESQQDSPAGIPQWRMEKPLPALLSQT